MVAESGGTHWIDWELELDRAGRIPQLVDRLYYLRAYARLILFIWFDIDRTHLNNSPTHNSYSKLQLHGTQETGHLSNTLTQEELPSTHSTICFLTFYQYPFPQYVPIRFPQESPQFNLTQEARIEPVIL